MIVAALALAGIFLAVYLLLYKLGMVGSLACSVGSCETVNTSKWATFLGIPVAGWGVAFYAGMFVLAMVSTPSCRCKAWRTIASPRPEPPRSRERPESTR